MKESIIKIAPVILILLTVAFLPTASVFADGPDCAILDCNQGIDGVLNLVVNILTIGVGILGVVGITIVGIQYLTAGGNEEKTRTAKRRLFEIVIGLAVYAVMYALLNWLGVGAGTGANTNQNGSNNSSQQTTNSTTNNKPANNTTKNQPSNAQNK